MSFQWEERHAKRTEQVNPCKAPRDAGGLASLPAADPGWEAVMPQWEERHLGQTERGPGMGQKRGFPLHQPEPDRRIPAGRATTVVPEPLPPFSDLVEIDCQDCGGSGYDPGGVNAQEAEDCSACHGSGKETIIRNYLSEAFRIAANPQSKLQLERAHLVALTAFARQTVSALMSVEEVA